MEKKVDNLREKLEVEHAYPSTQEEAKTTFKAYILTMKIEEEKWRII